MSMTNALDDVVYERRHFNYDPRDGRHPLWVTDKHFRYLLHNDAKGRLACRCDAAGQPFQSPRPLAGICAYRMVLDGFVTKYLSESSLPTDLYRPLLSEAIFHRDATAIIKLISSWPMTYLRVFDVIPHEDYLEDDYLTLKFENNENTTLLDCIIFGLLKLKSNNKLRYVDFARFDKDRRLCRELCRLPILWMNPENRTAEKIYDMLSLTIDISKDKVQKYVNKISFVYSNMDKEFSHGSEIDPVTLIVGMNMCTEDVPFGLGLQSHGPFRFACSRLAMSHIPEVALPLGRLGTVLDPKLITHYELEDMTVAVDEHKAQSLVEALAGLRHLVALSLPTTLDFVANQTMAVQLNNTFRRLKNLKRINLAYCNIRGHLRTLLNGIVDQLVYLNLRDCRLTQGDMIFLCGHCDLSQIRELNLSCNNLQDQEGQLGTLLQRLACLTCLSLSFCALTLQAQLQLVCQLHDSTQLKVMCLQGYTPLPWSDVHDLLFYCSQIESLQRLRLFPEAYAFPGDSDQARLANKTTMVRLAYRYLKGRHRTDIRLD